MDLDKQINDWFGGFYDMVQKLLAPPHEYKDADFYGKLFSFAYIAGKYIIVAVMLNFFTQHYVFAWRSAMNEYYASKWHLLRHIEGASQRVQEDTMRFAKLMESLAERFLDAAMTLIVFLPLLWDLSKDVKELPLIGYMPHGLVYVTLVFAIFGTGLLALVGVRLPGLEFNNQKVEAAYRKELVYGEDDDKRADTFTLAALFKDVRKNYFRLYFNYLYFNLVRYSYLQFTAIVPYLVLGPTLLKGAITLGLLQQILRAFGRVLSSFHFFVNSWTLVVEILSVYKRLRGFEKQMREQEKMQEVRDF